MLPIEPIVIWEKGHIRRTLNSVEGAARCLTEGWPGDRKIKSYRAALVACLAALEGVATADEARAAVVKAGKHAGILVE